MYQVMYFVVVVVFQLLAILNKPGLWKVNCNVSYNLKKKKEKENYWLIKYVTIHIPYNPI